MESEVCDKSQNSDIKVRILKSKKKKKQPEKISVSCAGASELPTWAAQSRGVTAGGEGCVGGRGDTFREGRED